MLNVSHQVMPRRNSPTRLAAADLFGRYKGEAKQQVRNFEVKKDEVMAQLREIWHRFNFVSGKRYDHNYYELLELLKGNTFSAKEIEYISIVIADFQDNEHFSAKAGLMISAMINMSKDTYHLIFTNHLADEPDVLGFKNTKNITIKGHAGTQLGFYMEEGTIIVNGDTGFMTGREMKGGKIIICGNTGNYLGDGMKGGTIVVTGNTGHDTGDLMTDGEIIICGNRFHLSDSAYNRLFGGGKIFIRTN